MSAAVVRWHYSLTDCYGQIKTSRKILASKSASNQVVGVVWFSSNQTIEPTARGCYSPARMPTSGAMVRYGVHAETPLERWSAPEAWRGITSEDWAWHLGILGIRVGADPEQWWFSRRDVLLRDLCAIERWENGVWKSIDNRRSRAGKPGAK